jgi:hypothetical protein
VHDDVQNDVHDDDGGYGARTYDALRGASKVQLTPRPLIASSHRDPSAARGPANPFHAASSRTLTLQMIQSMRCATLVRKSLLAARNPLPFPEYLEYR